MEDDGFLPQALFIISAFGSILTSDIESGLEGNFKNFLSEKNDFVIVQQDFILRDYKQHQVQRPIGRQNRRQADDAAEQVEDRKHHRRARPELHAVPQSDGKSPRQLDQPQDGNRIVATHRNAASQRVQHPTQINRRDRDALLHVEPLFRRLVLQVQLLVVVDVGFGERGDVLTHLRVQRLAGDRAVRLQEDLRVGIRVRRRAHHDANLSVLLHDPQHLLRRLGRAIGEQRHQEGNVVDVLDVRLDILDAAWQFRSVRQVRHLRRALLGAVSQATQRLVQTFVRKRLEKRIM